MKLPKFKNFKKRNIQHKYSLLLYEHKGINHPIKVDGIKTTDYAFPSMLEVYTASKKLYLLIKNKSNIEVFENHHIEDHGGNNSILFLFNNIEDIPWGYPTNLSQLSDDAYSRYWKNKKITGDVVDYLDKQIINYTSNKYNL